MGWSDTVYVEKLTEFSALLRQEGLTVGPQETADACAVLEVLDLTDRSTVRDALRAVYAKSRQEQAAFDSAFDGFFVSQERKEALFARRQAEAEELARRRAEAERELQVGGKPMDLREDLQEVYATMPEEKREYLRQLLEKSKGNLERSPLYRDISQFKDADIPRATALIARVAQQLSAELSKRRRRGGHSGQLDFKKTIRRGLETGGSFYRLSFRRKRHRRRRLVVLCDVSGSMLQFTEFTLRFLKSMAEVSDASRTFLFSEELREVDPFALQEMDAFRAYVRSSGLYGRGTDLGSALEALRQMKPSALGPGTTLLILSDTKTIDLPRAARELLEAKRLAGKVLWLNPIPERKWPYVRSIETMSALCQMVPCSTLEELARACRRLLEH